MDAPLNEYDVGQPIKLSCLFLTGQTAGQMLKGQTTVYVRDETGLTLTAGAAIVVCGADFMGGDLHTTVVSNAGGAIVVADACQTTSNQTTVGTPTDPATADCKVAQPDGVEVVCTPTSDTVGVWKATFTPTQEGDHFYRFVGTGPAAGERWRKFLVRPARVA